MASQNTAPEVPLATFIGGFDEALARLRAVKPEATEFDSAYHCVFEALNWAVAIADEARRTGNTAVADYPALKGLRAVRNPLHHQLAEAIRFNSGTFGEGAFGVGPYGGFEAWTWKPLDEIPEAPPRFQKDANYAPNREAYASALAHQIVVETLDDLSRLFDSIP